MEVVELIKLAQRRATATNRAYVVVSVPGGHVMYMPDGPLRGAKLLERCHP